MNTCEYCGQEVKRKIFCSPSHKSMYYRNLKKADIIVKNVNKIRAEQNKPPLTVPKPHIPKVAEPFKMPDTWIKKYEKK